MCVVAREDEVENEQEVAQPTEADATEASVDEEYVEDVGDDVDDGKVGVILSYTSLCSNCSYGKKRTLGYLLPAFKVIFSQENPLFALKN